MRPEVVDPVNLNHQKGKDFLFWKIPHFGDRGVEKTVSSQL
jgi:hypothetical protein